MVIYLLQHHQGEEQNNCTTNKQVQEISLMFIQPLTVILTWLGAYKASTSLLVNPHTSCKPAAN